MKSMNLLLAVLLLAAGIFFAGCLGGDPDSPDGEKSDADIPVAKDRVIGTWEGYDRSGKLQLVFNEDNTVFVNFRDLPTNIKTWKLEDGVYQIYDDDGYNSAKAVFQNDETLQYTTSGAVLYTLTRAV